MTNPDNVGGLPELPETIWLDSLAGRLYTANQMRAYGELCRAAPAGGDSRPDADWYRRNIEREPDDIGAGVPSLASPKGWVMVPAEPTAEMLRAGAIVEPPDSQWGQNYIEKAGARQCWDLMLRAAPKDSAPAGFSRNEKIEAIAKWLIAAAERGDRREVEESIYRLRNALSESAPTSKAEPIAYSGDLPGHKVMPGFIAPERMAALHKAIGHVDDSAPAVSGEVPAGITSMVIALVESARAEGGHRELRSSSDETVAYWTSRTAELAAALLRKLQQGAEYVMVPREPTSKMAALGAIAHKERGMAAAYRAMIAASQGQETDHARD